MGGVSSKTTVDVLNEICTQVTMDSMMECSGVATQDQMIAFQNIKGDVTISNVNMSQGVAVDLTCLMTANKQSDIADKVAAAIGQNADSKGQAFLSLFGNTKADATSNLKNQIMNRLSATTTEELKAQINQQQAIVAANVGGTVVMRNVSMDQSAKMVASSLMKTATYSSVINESANKMDQKSSAEEKNPIAEMIKAFDRDFVARFHSREVLKFIAGHDALALATDVHERFLGPDFDDGSLDDVAHLEGALVLFQHFRKCGSS